MAARRRGVHGGVRHAQLGGDRDFAGELAE